MISGKFWTNGKAHIMQSAILSDHINDLFKLCLQLENKFINLKPHMKKHIKVLRLRIRALHLVFLMKATNKSALNSTELLLKELDGLQKEEDIIQDFAFVKDLLHSLMDESQRKAGILVRILQPLLFKYPMESLDFDDHIKMAHAVIFEPIGNNDTPLKYTAGMTHFCSRIACSQIVTFLCTFVGMTIFMTHLRAAILMSSYLFRKGRNHEMIGPPMRPLRLYYLEATLRATQ